MKRYKLYIATLLICVGFTICPAEAQKIYDDGITIVPVRLEQHGEVLHIDIDFIIDEIKVKSAQGIDLIPQLVAPEKSWSLPMVSFKGRDEYLAYERKLVLMNEQEKAALQTPYTVEKAYKLNNDTIRYRHIVPYEPWMAGAHLDIQRDNCGCGKVELMDTELLVDKVTLEPDPVPYQITPHIVYLQPEDEVVKRREVQAEAFLDFAVNRTDIRPDYMNNPRELAKIRTMIDELNTDESIQVKSLDIIGYASPEGTLATNKRLSEGRAMALRNYLAGMYEFPLNAYRIVFGGENWDGLVKALSTMEMEYKDEVLDVINNVSIEDGRETRIMKMHNGAPYRFMLTHIFPSLRVAICKVEYHVKSFDVAEAKEVIKKNPKNLSQYEMYMVASTYPVGSEEFYEVFEIAAQQFPTDQTANLNAAASALMRNDLVSAEKYLNRVQPDTYKDTYNNVKGLLALMKGEYENAKIYLTTAADAGLEAARQNLKELERKLQNLKETNKKTN